MARRRKEIDQAHGWHEIPPDRVKKTADQWFAEYGDSHQDHTNEIIHWICVPVISCCVLGFIWSLPVPAALEARAPWFTWALPGMLGFWIFYARLSLALSAGMLLFMALCYAIVAMVEFFVPWAVWKVCLAAFALAWIGQFIGHKIEGKKPSFRKDLVFLLIGPAWLMSFVYKRLGQKY
jgi:uncharacterized membrane protein YGL010W